MDIAELHRYIGFLNILKKFEFSNIPDDPRNLKRKIAIAYMNAKKVQEKCLSQKPNVDKEQLLEQIQADKDKLEMDGVQFTNQNILMKVTYEASHQNTIKQCLRYNSMLERRKPEIQVTNRNVEITIYLRAMESCRYKEHLDKMLQDGCLQIIPDENNTSNICKRYFKELHSENGVEGELRITSGLTNWYFAILINDDKIVAYKKYIALQQFIVKDLLPEFKCIAEIIEEQNKGLEH